MKVIIINRRILTTTKEISHAKQLKYPRNVLQLLVGINA